MPDYNTPAAWMPGYTLHAIKPDGRRATAFWCGMGIWDSWGPDAQYTDKPEYVTCPACKSAMTQTKKDQP